MTNVNFSRSVFSPKDINDFTQLISTLTDIGPCLYLVGFEDDTKIGISYDPSKRLKIYVSPWSKPIRGIIIFHLKEGDSKRWWHYCCKLETEYKMKYKDKAAPYSHKYFTGIMVKDIGHEVTESFNQLVKIKEVKWQKRLENIKNCKPVLCISTGQEFQSLAQCARHFNMDRGPIAKVCNGFIKTYKGLKFEWI